MKKEKKKRTKLEKQFKILRFFEKLLFRTLFPYKLHGNLTKYNEGSLITIGNHYHIFDVMYPCRITDRPVIYVAKAELWEKKGFMRWLVNHVKCCIPAKRDGSDVKTVKECMRVLKNDGVVNIFPEGTRNHSYADLLPFHSGAAALSIKTKTPIVPIVKITKPTMFKKTHVVVGDPIEFRQYYGKKVTKEQLEECDNILRESIKNIRLAFMEKYKIVLKSDKV